ncbi:MAG: Fic family protein [Ginsengibacter sp.]
MENSVYIFKINLDWQLISFISKLDRFDASWTSIERRQKQNLKELKSIATVRSVGASTRIEGSKLTDEEVDVLLKDIDITKLKDRDSQEVVGYFETLDIISATYDDIQISVGDIKNLHNVLMKYNTKDAWHRGDYKQHGNAVAAKYPDGTSQIIFQTTEPGFATENSIDSLIKWYNNEKSIHPLVKCSIFIYEFLSIHPFQDGNGRLSRLLSSLLLLKNGYKWIQYVSFEHEIESRKLEYYKVLRSCQALRPNENISDWVNFFFDALKNIQVQLMHKLQIHETDEILLPREKLIASFIQSHPGCKSGEIAKGLNISRMIIIRSLLILIEKNIIEKHGIGSGTHYSYK